MKKRQTNNLANGYMEIQRVIDEKQKKLYDRLENIKLSHNRKFQLLEKIQNYIKILSNSQKLDEFGLAITDEIIQKINTELNFVGRMKGN